MKILITSTSFQDTPGKHHSFLNEKNLSVDLKRGPLTESQLLDIDWSYDGIIMGDDEYSEEVILKAKNGGLKILSKYGVGLDKVDLDAAKKHSVEVRNCPGLNFTTVAEHVFALLLSFKKNIMKEVAFTSKGEWTRLSGGEITGKKIAIIGLGKIGKEVSRLARCFNMDIYCFDKFLDKDYVEKSGVKVINDLNKDLKEMDIISLHCNLDSESTGLISKEILLNGTSDNVILLNTARAHLVDREALHYALNEKKIGAYLADVWYEEPMQNTDPLKDFENVLITPHIASRTIENVEKQGIQAIENLTNFLDGLK